MVDRTPTSSAILPARPRPSEWLKPTDVPRPARWHRRLLLIGAPEAGLVAAPGKTALLRPALDSCSGCGEATIVVISGVGCHPDRKSTRLTPVTNAHNVCRILHEKIKHIIGMTVRYNTIKTNNNNTRI